MPEIASSAADPRPIRSASATPKPEPAPGQRWSAVMGYPEMRRIFTLVKHEGPGCSWVCRGNNAERVVTFDPKHPQVRYEGPDWDCWLPSADLPVTHDNRPQVGEMWAVGAMGYRVVVGIDAVDEVNRPAVKATIYAVDTDLRFERGRSVTLAESMMQAVKVGDDTWTPLCDPTALARAAASQVVPGANPACGCSQETVCAAHEKPNQSAGPGEILAKGEAIHRAAAAAIDEALAEIAPHYQKPPVAPTRTMVSMNGRDWLNYAHLDEAAEPLNRYPHWQIWRGDELLIFRPEKAEPLTCVVTSETSETGVCGAPATIRPTRSRSPICDRCYLAHERDLGHLTARRPEHWKARMRMDVMAYNERGYGRLFGPELPRPCTPTPWGGIFDPQADR